MYSFFIVGILIYIKPNISSTHLSALKAFALFDTVKFTVKVICIKNCYTIIKAHNTTPIETPTDMLFASIDAIIDLTFRIFAA